MGLYAQTACVWEAVADKAGNVNRRHDFADVTLVDFLLSAAALAPVLDRAGAQTLGLTILQAVQATRQVTATNTNLGMILLLAPLASVPLEEDLRSGVRRVLEQATVEDSRLVYQAIQLAMPGGLGEAPEQDVRAVPTVPLRTVMALAAQRDLVARQYANDFQEVVGEGISVLRRELKNTGGLSTAIVQTHLHFMAQYPDSLIARKRGLEEAGHASRLARTALQTGYPHHAAGQQAFADLDRWLRAEGHQRNPGTSADLVTACLFAALREGIIKLPVAWQSLVEI